MFAAVAVGGAVFVTPYRAIGVAGSLLCFGLVLYFIGWDRKREAGRVRGFPMDKPPGTTEEDRRIVEVLDGWADGGRSNDGDENGLKQ